MAGKDLFPEKKEGGMARRKASEIRRLVGFGLSIYLILLGIALLQVWANSARQLDLNIGLAVLSVTVGLTILNQMNN